MLPTKISESELAKTLVERLPLRPASESKYRSSPMTGEEIRASFDQSAKLITERLNQVVDFLSTVGTDSGVKNLPYSTELTLGQTLDEIGLLIDELNTLTEQVQDDLSKAKDDYMQKIATLQVKTYGDITALEVNTSNSIAALGVKTNADIAALESTLSALQASLGSAETAIGKMQTTITQNQTRSINNQTKLSDHGMLLEDLKSSLQSLIKNHRETAELAQNAVQQKTEIGIYAHDFDSKIGSTVERIIPYSPSSNDSYKADWCIAQRDGDGCLQGQAPKKDYQLTPKFYVEEHFTAKKQVQGVTVNGRTQVDSWVWGEIYEYGNGGEPTYDTAMKSACLDGKFEKGEHVTFYSDQAGTFVIDIYNGEHYFTHDDESGLYRLEYTQETFDYSDPPERSCRVNAPQDATVYYTSESAEDPTVLTVSPLYEYELTGAGTKKLNFENDPQLYRQSAGGEVHVRFSSDAVKIAVKKGSYPFYFYGDHTQNGTLTVLPSMRYDLAFSYDGVGFVCRVFAYPLP